MKKSVFNTIIMVGVLVITLAFAGFSTALASSSTKASSKVLINKIPDWPPVYEEKMADGTTWYAFAKCNVYVKDWKEIKDGEVFILTNQYGSFPAEIKIFNPQPRPASIGGRSPERIWVTFKTLMITWPSDCPRIGPAVLFKVW